MKQIIIGTVAVGAVVVAAGCTTMDGGRNTSMRERSATEGLREEVARLSAVVHETEEARLRQVTETDRFRAQQERRNATVIAELQKLEQGLKQAGQKRGELRTELEASLSKKIAAILRSQVGAGGGGQVGREHVIESGQTLSQIARAYGVSVKAVVRANNLKDANAIRVGQKLFIPE